MENPIIFYGAGEYAEQNLKKWEESGFFPVCFTDSNHYCPKQFKI